MDLPRLMGIASAGLILGLAGCQQASWPELLSQLEEEFPEVRDIPPKELKAWLEDSTRPPPLLLDVREEAEFAMSHLAGAEHLQPGTLPPSVTRGQPKQTPIVTYCSVGYRSSQAVVALMEAGYTNVMNLEGSIFAWANQGYPLVRGEETVNEVHPYNAEWGRFLDAEYHAVP